jgi:serine/threonine protein kinase
MADAPGPDSGRSRAALPPALAAYSEYEVIRELGRGGMGVVYLARNRLTDRLEALKLRTGMGHTEEFLREVQAAARLTHPHLVAVYSARLILGTLVLAMEYIDGCDLAELVAERGPLRPADACELIRQAALGLQHAHDAGVVHRDVKPANLSLSLHAGQLTVKILDFGIARAGDDTENLSPGTPAFAAPEQFDEPRHADARSDLYALGGTLYYLITGERPFQANSWAELLRQHREEPPPRLDPERYGVPDEVAALVERMMAKDPNDRPQSAAEIVTVLARHAGTGEPILNWLASRPSRAETLNRISGWTPIVRGDFSLAATVKVNPTPHRVPRASKRPPVWAGLLAVVLVAGLCAGWAARGRPRTPGIDSVPTPVLGVAPPPVSLFDGRSLDGWMVDGGDQAEWWVEDGAIVTIGTRDGARTWLLSENEYRDFRISFHYRLGAGGNSGFALRAVPGECPVLRGSLPTPVPYHQQIEISDDSSGRWPLLPTGQVNGSGTTTGPALKPHRPARLLPAGEWNRMEVELRGHKVRVCVNGEEVLSDDLRRLIELGSPYPALHRARGRIGFQQQARTAAFRNIMIEELMP